MKFKIIVTLIFVITILVRYIFPNIIIDNTTIILLLFAIAPWVMQYIKLLEVNGIGKVELVNNEEKNKIEEIIKDSGIEEINPKENMEKEYSFYIYKEHDSKLALAGIRIELESLLRKIAKHNCIDIDKKNYGIGALTNTLYNNNLVTSGEKALIYDIIGILNKAVHSQLDERNLQSVEWIFDVSQKLLKSLEEKCK